MQVNPAAPSPETTLRQAARKAALRREILAQRKALSQVEHATRSLDAQALVLALDAWRNAGEILCYCAVRGEVDTQRLLDDAWARNLHLLLPRCVPGAPGVMELAGVACPAELRPGAFNIPEPDPATCPMLPASAPDVAVIPGLAFDRAGHRLGYGGGYYDRLLAPGRVQPRLRIGLCFSFQLVADPLPADPWDAAMDVLVTESEVVWPSR
ncbi:5-formyltetrahydrofolate cyclo-ligase [Megalodesulfovibrio paquesii]